MSLRVFEHFGYPPLDPSAEATKQRSSKNCPFVPIKCVKKFRSGLVSGVCTVKPVTSGPVICCPNRMYAEDYRVLIDVARTCFGGAARLCSDSKNIIGDGLDVQVFGKRWGKELRLPNATNTGGYFVDWVLARVGPGNELLEFVAVELQTMDTTGSYEAEIVSYNKGMNPEKASTAGINWENVSKRILPQIIYKGHVLRREPKCTKGLFFVCPRPVYERIKTRLGGSFQEYHPQAGALTFRWYDVSPDQTSGVQSPLEFHGQLTTTIDQVALAFTSPSNLPMAGVYETAIQVELKASS